MKKTLSFFAVAVIATAFSAGVPAQVPHGGGISPEILSELEKGYEGTASDKAIRNALNSTPINTLAATADKPVVDTHFSDVVKTKGRTDQASSGRCWLFCGLNVLRAKMIDRFDLGDFRFSQNYVFFYDQLEKANLFLQSVIDTRDIPFYERKVEWLFENPISDGGQFTGVSNLVMKYGLVPSDAMPESYSSNNTYQMRVKIANKLREDGLLLRDCWEAADKKDVKSGKALESLEQMKVLMLKEIYRMLAICLGTPPTEFTWARYNADGILISEETYTPKSFYDTYVGEDLEKNYVMLMNDPTREYWKVYEIEYDRHVYDGENWLYINLPVERIKEMAIASIKDNTAMYFSCDVGKFLDRKTGLLDEEGFDYESLMGVTFGMDKRRRVLTHDSGSSHAMSLIGVDIKDGKPVKWMVENSWGADSGYKGNLIMTDKWFDDYMFRLVVEKKYVPADVLGMLDQEPILLPSWDPMFLPEQYSSELWRIR